MNDSMTDLRIHANRRYFFSRTSAGLGSIALGSLLSRDLMSKDILARAKTIAPKAKRVIYLFQSGAPSQMDLFDYKPEMNDRFDEDLPDGIRNGQRLTGMTSGQARFPIAPSIFKFSQRGESGAWVSDLMPHLSGVVDKLCFVKSMYTEAINHDPAITFFQTG